MSVVSPEIERASLHVSIPWYNYLYTVPFLSLYPVLAYAYFIKYDDWLGSEEWTFLACTTLGVCHALSFLSTRWNAGARAWITTKKVRRGAGIYSSLMLIPTFRPAALKKPTASASCRSCIAARAILCRSNARIPATPARILLFTNGIPIPSLPLTLSHSVASLTPLPATLRFRHSTNLPLSRQVVLKICTSSMARMNSTFRFLRSPSSSRNRRLPPSLCSRSFVSPSGVWTNIGITACLLSSC